MATSTQLMLDHLRRQVSFYVLVGEAVQILGQESKDPKFLKAAFHKHMGIVCVLQTQSHCADL